MVPLLSENSRKEKKHKNDDKLRNQHLILHIRNYVINWTICNYIIIIN
jgi:hypothetical protein